MKNCCCLIISFSLLLGCHPILPDSYTSDPFYDKELKTDKDFIGKRYPTLNVSNRDKQWSSESLLGKTVYINFWFAACPPCMAEMPYINNLYNRYKADTNFVLLSITFENQKKIDSVRATHHIEYEIYQVSREECQQLNPFYGFPANVVVDGNRFIKFYKVGGMWSQWHLKRLFKKKIYPVIDDELKETR